MGIIIYNNPLTYSIIKEHDFITIKLNGNIENIYVSLFLVKRNHGSEPKKRNGFSSIIAILFINVHRCWSIKMVFPSGSVRLI